VNYIEELTQALSRLDIAPLIDFVRDCQGTLWLAGNGGSASTAQHWACDLSKAAGRRVQALGSNPAVLTAWANDSDYANIFGAELSRLAQPGDRLICLSCSGTSANIYYALREAGARGILSALVTSKLYCDDDADLTIRVPHTHYGIIEDCHLAIGHWLTEALCSR
jgi:D-sedoheptulose 7-phosphate isomerase